MITDTKEEGFPANLSYFIEWGSKKWEKLISFAIRNYLGENLKKKKLLEIGPRYGKMSCLFALLGAEVTAVDISYDYIKIAQNEAKKWDIEKKINFIKYDGDLDIFKDETFDFVFTKSVLVSISDLDLFLKNIKSKIKSGGKVVFVENGYGNIAIQLCRNFRHKDWNFRSTNYFTKQDILTIRKLFEVDIIKRSYFPPIYLIGARRP